MQDNQITFQNETLHKLYTALVKHSAQKAEFIPQISYALYQLKEDPNNSANNLATATLSITHRIKICKNLIIEDPQCIELLSTSCDEWSLVVEQRRLELDTKKQVQMKLSERIRQMIK